MYVGYAYRPAADVSKSNVSLMYYLYRRLTATVIKSHQFWLVKDFWGKTPVLTILVTFGGSRQGKYFAYSILGHLPVHDKLILSFNFYFFYPLHCMHWNTNRKTITTHVINSKVNCTQSVCQSYLKLNGTEIIHACCYTLI